MQTYVGNSCAKPSFAHLKAMPFLKWLTECRVSVMAKGVADGDSAKYLGACVTVEVPIV